MIDFSYATNINIKRFQNLLETSLDEPERQTIQKLLAEDSAASVRTEKGIGRGIWINTPAVNAN